MLLPDFYDTPIFSCFQEKVQNPAELLYLISE